MPTVRLPFFTRPAGGDYADITRSLTATESDDDTGDLDFSTTALERPRGRSSATYTMRLKFQPTATVAVLLAHSTGDPDITVNPPAVVFTPTNWAVARTVTLTAASDNDLADGMATIRPHRDRRRLRWRHRRRYRHRAG